MDDAGVYAHLHRRRDRPMSAASAIEKKRCPVGSSAQVPCAPHPTSRNSEGCAVRPEASYGGRRMPQAGRAALSHEWEWQLRARCRATPQRLLPNWPAARSWLRGIWPPATATSAPSLTCWSIRCPPPTAWWGWTPSWTRGCSIPSWPCLAVRNANELTTRWLVAGELGELVPSNQLWRCSGPAQPSAARVVGRISTRQHSPELLTLIGRNELWNAMHGPPNLLSCCH